MLINLILYYHPFNIQTMSIENIQNKFEVKNPTLLHFYITQLHLMPLTLADCFCSIFVIFTRPSILVISIIYLFAFNSNQAILEWLIRMKTIQLNHLALMTLFFEFMAKIKLNLMLFCWSELSNQSNQIGQLIVWFETLRQTNRFSLPTIQSI